jgi:molecular chaperone DnaJ
MTTRESFRILGVNSKAELEEVRRRFRFLAQKYHPDRNPDNPKSADQFRRVVEAYEKVQAHLARTPRTEKHYYRRNCRTAKQEFFEEILGLDPEDDTLAQSMGPDFRYDFRIPFVDALMGLSTTITVPILATCACCDGRGRVPAAEPQVCPECHGQGRPVKGPGLFRSGPGCRHCRGTGQIQEQSCPVCEGKGQFQQFRPFHLDIPAGTEDGARFRFEGEGGASLHGGPPGNLEVVVSVAPHEFFTRKGRDLFCQFEVSFAQAALGGEVRVPTLLGFATLNLPRGTRSGCIFCFPAAGAPGNLHQPPGDQYVEVVVTTPESLNISQPNIVEKLAGLGKNEMDRAAHE